MNKSLQFYSHTCNRKLHSYLMQSIKLILDMVSSGRHIGKFAEYMKETAKLFSYIFRIWWHLLCIKFLMHEAIILKHNLLSYRRIIWKSIGSIKQFLLCIPEKLCRKCVLIIFKSHKSYYKHVSSQLNNGNNFNQLNEEYIPLCIF